MGVIVIVKDIAKQNKIDVDDFMNYLQEDCGFELSKKELKRYDLPNDQIEKILEGFPKYINRKKMELACETSLKYSQSYISNSEEANLWISCVRADDDQVVYVVIHNELYSLTPADEGFFKLPTGIHQVRFVIKKAYIFKCYDKAVAVENDGKKTIVKVSVGNGVARITVD